MLAPSVTVVVVLALCGCGALLLGGCGSWTAGTAAGAADTVSQTPGEQTPGVLPSSPSPQPPAWLLEKMRLDAQGLEGPDVSAWWTLTTAQKAAVVMDESSGVDTVVHPERAVYVVIYHGLIDGSRVTHPYGATPGPYTWMCELIDAGSRLADVVALRNRPFDTSGVEMNPVEL